MLQNIKKKIICLIYSVIILALLFYSISVLLSQKTYNPDFGISFDPEYATYLGLDWKEVYREALHDLQPTYIRIAAKWHAVESENNVFDYGNIDWMMDAAEKHNTQVVLVIGQKAPRWPECFIPNWVYEDKSTYKEQVLAYIEKTVNRYKNHKALYMWQVENEPFIHFTFGSCPEYNQEVVYDEIGLVKKLDSNHKVMVTDSGEMGLWKKAAEAGDVFGTTLYRIVQNPKGKIFSYFWMPAGFYNLKAKVFGIAPERMMISELQAEPWFSQHNTENTPQTMSDQQIMQLMSPNRLQEHINYAQHINTSAVFLWGTEWWYFMKERRNNSQYWEMVREVFVENGTV